jgi:hypothetical protein
MLPSTDPSSSTQNVSIDPLSAWLAHVIAEPEVQELVLLGYLEGGLPQEFFPLGLGARMGVSCL